MSLKSDGVNPLRAYRAPGYPTIDEIGLADLSRAPDRWQRLKLVVASLGTVAMTMRAFAQDAASAREPTVQAPATRSAKDAAKITVKTAAEQPVTDVCPLQPVAVAGSGRGGFGCVSVCPPVMLSECEALEIIEREFAKRGVKLKDCPELDGVELPSKPGQKRPVMLDLGNEKGDVLVEFISLKDEKTWSDPPDPNNRVYCSVRTWDLRALAERAGKAFAARNRGKPVSVGILYDPVAHPKKPSETDRTQSREDGWKAYHAEGVRLAEKQLVAQLEGLFTHLARQGKMPKGK